MPTNPPKRRRKGPDDPQVAAAYQAFGRLLRHHVLILGTRPAGTEKRAWTTEEFRLRLPGRDEDKKAAKRTVEYWFAGESLPDHEYTFPAILRVLFGGNERDGGEDRQALRTAYEHARRTADAAVLEREQRKTNGYVAGPAGKLIGFNTAPAADNVEAARDPAFQAEHAEVSELARAFAEMVAAERSNALAFYPLLRRAAERFAEAMAHPAEELPHWVVKAYQSCVMLAAAYDDDRRYRADPGDGAPLPTRMQSALGVMLELAVPLLLTLPYVQRKDQSLRDFRRSGAVADSRAVAQRLERGGDMTPEAADILRDLLALGAGGGTQGEKADEQLVSTIINTLLFGGAGILRTTRDLDRDLVERLRALFRDTRAPIERLIEGESLFVQGALRHALSSVAAARRGEDTPWPPRTPFVHWRDEVPGLPAEAWPDMVTLPKGRFLMGAPAGEERTIDEERPQREVTVERPFAIGRVAVTFAQWDAAMAEGFVQPKRPERSIDRDWGRGDRPVIHVSWDDAQAYCTWLNERLGLRAGTYRLPSEAEWEYACRAGTTTRFSFGDRITKKQVNHDDGRGGFRKNRTVPVGSLPPNDWGLHEMHGNVWEWCQDLFGDSPDQASDSRRSTGRDSSYRVLRGGSWFFDSRLCRSAFRFRDVSDARSADYGFRLARSLF